MPKQASELILVVEDDADVRNLTLAILRHLGYRTLDAPTAAEGMEILSARSDIDLLLTDVVLPGGSGVQLAEQARRKYPGLRVLFMSGYTGEALTHESRIEPGFVLLQKPFGTRQLAEKVQAVLGKSVR